MAKARTVAIVILFLLPLASRAASLSISPASGSFQVGDRVSVRVVVSSATPINAISGTVEFPTDVFTVDSVSKAGSILNFWVTEPSFLQAAGELNFEGVTLGGYPGGTATVVTVTLRAVKAGTGTINFKSGQILANDGQGTDVTDGLNSATYSVTPAPANEAPPAPAPVTTEAPQPPPSLNAPEISLTSKFDEEAISGTSNYPKAQVLLTFQDESGTKIFIEGTTDDLGNFLLTVPHTLKHGAYSTSAVVIEPDLTHSPSSNVLTITVGNFISDIGWEVRLFLLILIIVLILLTIYEYVAARKNKNLRKVVRKEAQDSELLVHKSFKLLHEDMDELSDKTVSAERKDIHAITKEMNEAEDIITKEIKKIENT